MATTTTQKGNFLTIVWATAKTDWVYETEVPEFPNKMKVRSIQFNPSAASDALVVREGSLTGPKLMSVVCADATDQRVKYFGNDGVWMKPYIEADDCVFDTLTSVEVIIELA